jgi:hypothetical protein
MEHITQLMTSNLFFSRYGELFLEILKNPFIGFPSHLFLLPGGENLPQKKPC